MNKKEQLYYTLKEYINGGYNTMVFCSTFYDIFYPDTPKDELTEYEYEEFERLASATARFSQYEEDFIKYPKAYVSAEEIRKIAESVYKKVTL